jgi:protein-glutamine gamma-glutamyltransferase
MNRGGEDSAERFFQWSLYLLLVTGFVALMGTGKLDLPSLVLVIPALVLRAYFLLMRKEVLLSERATSLLTLAYFAFYAADYFYLSQSFVDATVHMVLFSLVIKIFSIRRYRDLIYLIALSFMMLLAAAVLTVDTTFLLTFALFTLVAMATFISMEMRRSEKAWAAARVPARRGRELYRSLAGVASLLFVFTLAGSALIFLLLPRVSSGGYLRNFGVQSAMATGFSQDVRLGGIGEIQQSNAAVMHIQVLDGKLPDDPKWRGVALANFDGQRWWNPPQGGVLRGALGVALDLPSVSPSAFYSSAAAVTPRTTLRYRVVMEPMGLNMFFLAPVPLKLSGSYRAIAVDPDGSVFSADGSGGVGVYTAESDTRDPERWVRDSNTAQYPARISKLYLSLPELDPRISSLAHAISDQRTSNYSRARAIEDYLKRNYSYTLQLPGPKPDPLAYFLFERRKGHCEYFASSMTVMLRSLGIPARMVNGFRGGEYNDLTGNYIIRERDAHSWVEAYFPEYGWVSFDPTPAGPGTPTADRWSRLALYLDAVSGIWREWVVNYDFNHQMRLSSQLSATTGNAHSVFRTWLMLRYRRLLDGIEAGQRRMQRLTPAQMTWACVLLAILLALPFLPKAWRSVRQARARRDPRKAPGSAASFWYLRLLKRLARRGIRKTAAQTPGEFTSSILDPALRRNVSVFTDHYQRARFAGSVEDAERLPELYEELAGKKRAGDATLD